MTSDSLAYDPSWVDSGGGPLIVLQESALPYWNGADNVGEALPPRPGSVGSDYALACSVRGLVGVREVRGSDAIILGDEPLSTRWWRSGRSGVLFLLRWHFAESEDEVDRYLATIDDLQFAPLDLTFNTAGERLFLFDSAMPGTDILTPHTTAELVRGRYRLTSTELKPDERTKVLAVRLEPA